MNKSTVATLFKSAKKIFFIGIGGISMSSLAMIAKSRGFEVGGSDRTCTALTQRLEKSGIPITYEHHAENIIGYQAIVYIPAIAHTPEKIEAEKQGIPCVSRGEFLGYLMVDYQNRIGISGMHGKSTTTSMVSHIFLEANFDPTIVNGAELTELNGAYRIGGKQNFIFEACEYTDSFLSFFPTIAVVLNIDMDHVDYFHSMEQIIQSFHAYISITGEKGYAILNWENENVQKAAENYRGHIIKYGICGNNFDYTAKEITFEKGFAHFSIVHKGNFLCEVSLSVPGEHNIMNAIAAAAAAHLCGVPAEAIARGLHSFKGAKRRFEKKGSFHGVDVFDDYAHHPSEIKTTLAGIRKLGYRKIWCVYQPHTYSRTAELFDDFVQSFGDADTVIFADIYAAREENTYPIFSKDLADQIPNSMYLPTFETISAYLKENAQPNDLILTMGAGDIFKVANLLLN